MARAARAHLGGEVRRSVLPSGLRVVTENMRGSQTFNIGVFIGVGSRHETSTLHGASHFLEHVLFKGTARRSPEEIAQAIESVGGDINAYTAKEHTCFYARVLATDADLAVDVLTDMLTSSLVLSHEVDAERAVILEEIAMHADDPGEVAAEFVTTQIFGTTSLGLPVIGSEESVTALSRAQVVRHWKRNYIGSRMVVAVTGQVDHHRLVAQLGSLGGAGAARSPTRRVTRTRTNDQPVVLTAIRRLEQCTATLSFPSPGVFDERRYPLGLLSVIMGGGMASRLFVEVRERRGLTYGIDAGETAYSDGGLWSVDWQCAPDKLAEILTLVRRSFLDLCEYGVTGGELARAKGQMRGQTVLSYEGPSTRMGRLGVAELMGDTRTIAEALDRYDAVTAEDVQREATTLLGQSPVLAVVGPRVNRPRLQRILRDWVA